MGVWAKSGAIVSACPESTRRHHNPTKTARIPAQFPCRSCYTLRTQLAFGGTESAGAGAGVSAASGAGAV